MNYSKRPVLGLTEKIIVFGKGKKKELVARIDTGATKSSIHSDLVKELKLGPFIGKKLVKSSNGQSVREMVMVSVVINGIRVRKEFTIADRTHLRYKVLIGQNILKTKGFFIDPKK